MRKHLLGLWLVSVGSLLPLTPAVGVNAPVFDIRPEQAVLERLIPQQASQFELAPIAAADGHERFRISSTNGHIKVEGSTPSSLLFGVNWYLKYIAHVQISTNGDRLGTRVFPLPGATIEREKPRTPTVMR